MHVPKANHLAHEVSIMSSERKVSRTFIRYMQQVLRNERINIYRKYLNTVKETPLEEWLLEEIAEPGHLEDFLLTDDGVDHLEFFENERLAAAIATLSTADKMVLYQYYYSELNDVEIGSHTDKTSQGVNKRQRRALARIKEAYEKV